MFPGEQPREDIPRPFWILDQESWIVVQSFVDLDRSGMGNKRSQKNIDMNTGSRGEMPDRSSDQSHLEKLRSNPRSDRVHRTILALWRCGSDGASQEQRERNEKLHRRPPERPQKVTDMDFTHDRRRVDQSRSLLPFPARTIFPLPGFRFHALLPDDWRGRRTEKGTKFRGTSVRGQASKHTPLLSISL